MSFFTWAVRTFWRSSTDFTDLQHLPSYSNGNANLFSTIFEFVFELFLILFSLEKRLEIGSSTTFYNTRSEHVMNILKKGVLSFRDKAGNSYSIAQDCPIMQREAFHWPPVQGPILTFQWLSQVSPEHATGILSPKPQFSKTVKTNFNLMVKPKSLITTHFFFKFFKIAFSACIWTLNEACEWKQKNTCAWRYFLQVHVIQLIAPSPEVPQTAFAYSGNGKGRTISFLKHPMNCADT